MEPTVRAIECVNEPEPVPGGGVEEVVRMEFEKDRKMTEMSWNEWKVFDKRKKEHNGPASITTEPGRICNQEVIKAISAR